METLIGGACDGEGESTCASVEAQSVGLQKSDNASYCCRSSLVYKYY
jgi:hypothetical protein